MSTSSTLPDTDHAIDVLNTLLRGEVAAVETYQLALAKFGAAAPFELHDNLRSHQQRVAQLGGRIAALGGQPVDGSGLWGAFARLVEGGASLFGRINALAALEEGEDLGVARYRAYLDELDPASRALLESDLLPEQARTHEVISDLLFCAPDPELDSES